MFKGMVLTGFKRNILWTDISTARIVESTPANGFWLERLIRVYGWSRGEHVGNHGKRIKCEAYDGYEDARAEAIGVGEQGGHLGAESRHTRRGVANWAESK